jgi:hypothetical protein
MPVNWEDTNVARSQIEQKGIRGMMTEGMLPLKDRKLLDLA